MQPDKDQTPQPQPRQPEKPLDKPQLSQSIYPTPTSGRLVPAPTVQPTATRTQENGAWAAAKIPWLKIAGLGALLPMIFAIIGVFLLRFDSDRTANAVLLLGWSFAFAFLPLVAFITSTLVFRKYLRRWGMGHPTAIAVSASCVAAALYYFLYHARGSAFDLMNESNHTSPVGQLIPLILVAALLTGPVVFCLSTYLFERVKLSTALKYALVVALVVIPVGGYFFWIISQSTAEHDVKDVAWAQLPTKLPAGYEEDKYCPGLPVSYYFMCEYSFSQYPGFISAASQQTVKPNSYTTKQININMKETEKDDRFAPYLYNNGVCSIQYLSQMQLVEPRNRSQNNSVPSPGKQKCTQLKTPAGNILYAQAEYLPTPAMADIMIDYYFIKQDAVVSFRVGGASAPQETDWNFAEWKTIMQDPSLQSQLMEFVDSFRPTATANPN